MLVAGVSVNNPTSFVGALAFGAASLPSDAWLTGGSAFIYLMLLAGAAANGASANGGALTFYVSDSPGWGIWPHGSANKNISIQI